MKHSVSFKYGQKSFLEYEPEIIKNGDKTEYILPDGLALTVTETHYPNGAVMWLPEWENRGDKNSLQITDAFDLDTVFENMCYSKMFPGDRTVEGDLCLYSMNGMTDGRYYSINDTLSALEFATVEHFFRPGYCEEVNFCTRTGRSSEDTAPYFELNKGDEGVFIAIGWTGSWRFSARLEDYKLHCKAGLMNLDLYLKPGERIRTASILIMPYSNGRENGSNAFRRLLKSYFSRPNTSIFACEFWGGLPDDKMLSRLKVMREHGVRFDQLWLDAGWYGNCTDCKDNFSGDWGLYVGDWFVNERVHPGKLKDVAEEARRSGSGMMLWFETEHATPLSEYSKKYRDVFIKGDTEYLIDLSKEQGVEYAVNTVSRFIEELGLTVYRQDFNIPPSPIWAKNDEEGRCGILEIGYVTGLYKFWDTVLEKYPYIVIDNCASGGRRSDFEALSRSTMFFRSDYQCVFNADPDVLQVHHVGANRVLPLTGCTTKAKGDIYAYRSAYSASFGFACWNAVFQEMTDSELDLLAHACDEYRSIREYFSEDFYNLGSAVLDHTAWAAMQYDRPEKGDGLITVFRRRRSAQREMPLYLKALLPDAVYEIVSLDTGDKLRMTGRELMDGALVAATSRPHESLIFRYEKV